MKSRTCCNKATLMNRFVLGAIATVLLTASFGPGADKDQPLPPLSAEYAKWRDHVLPNASEQSQRKIAWRTSALHGIVDAQKNDRPVMLFLMNGHPLGCT